MNKWTPISSYRQMANHLEAAALHYAAGAPDKSLEMVKAVRQEIDVFEGRLQQDIDYMLGREASREKGSEQG